MIKFKSHSFREKIYFKRKAFKQRYVKTKPSLTKYRIELLKDTTTLGPTFPLHMPMYTGIWKFVWKMQGMDVKW